MAPSIEYVTDAVPQFVQDENPKQKVGLLLVKLVKNVESDKIDIPVELSAILKEFRRRCFMAETPDSVLSTVAHFESPIGMFVSLPVYARQELHYLSLGIKDKQKDIFLRVSSLGVKEDNQHAKEIVRKDFIDFYSGSLDTDPQTQLDIKFLATVVKCAGLPRGLKVASGFNLRFDEEEGYLQDLVSEGFDEFLS